MAQRLTQRHTHRTAAMVAMAGSVGLAAVAAWAGGPPASERAVSFRTIALTGEPAPGAPSGYAFWDVGSPVVNNRGEAVFEAMIGPGPAPDPAWETGPSSIWTERNGGLTLISMEGDPATGIGSRVISGVSRPAASRDGRGVNFAASFHDPDVIEENTIAFYGEEAGGLIPLARDGQIISGYQNPLSGLADMESDGAGGVGFRAIMGDTPLAGLADADGIDLRSVMLGSPIEAPQGNAMGELVLRYTDTTSAAPGEEPQGIVRMDEQFTVAIARTGDPAPGIGTDAEFERFGAVPVLNDIGEIAFHSTVSGSDIGPLNNQAIWLGHDGEPEHLVRTGQTYQGDIVVADINPRPAITNTGTVAAVLSLSGPGVDPSNNQALVRFGTGGASLADKTIVRRGDAVPGMTDTQFNMISDPVATGRDELVFTAWLTGEGVEPGANQGLFVATRGGLLTLATQGAPFQIPGGDTRIVRDIIFNPEHRAGGRAGASDIGQVAFRLRFEDGSAGLFMATPCMADLTGSTPGVPDGEVDINDFFYYLDLFADGDPAADLTGLGDGVPDGEVDINDFFFYLDLFSMGC